MNGAAMRNHTCKGRAATDNDYNQAPRVGEWAAAIGRSPKPGTA